MLSFHYQQQIGCRQDLGGNLPRAVQGAIKPVLHKQLLCCRIDPMVNERTKACGRDMNAPSLQSSAHHHLGRWTATDVADTDKQNILEHYLQVPMCCEEGRKSPANAGLQSSQPE